MLSMTALVARQERGRLLQRVPLQRRLPSPLSTDKGPEDDEHLPLLEYFRENFLDMVSEMKLENTRAAYSVCRPQRGIRSHYDHMGWTTLHDTHFLLAHFWHYHVKPLTDPEHTTKERE